VTRIKLKGIDRFRDRHGKLRHYFRAGRGKKRVPLPGAPGSPEFMAAYESLVGGRSLERIEPKSGIARLDRAAPGTFDRLVFEYFNSPDFLRLVATTQRAYRSVIERMVLEERIGHRLVSEMTREHVKRMISKRSASPGAANDLLKKLRLLLNFAIDSGWRNDNPATRIKKFAEGEFHTWTDAEISAFEARWSVGTTARLAFALLLYTGQRRSDVVRMAWDDVQDGMIQVVQQKTKAKLWVPIHPQLAAILETCSGREGTILQTSFGKAFTSNGFGNMMASRIGDAGLQERCVTHGLRKAAARRLAEAGCSANEIASITGHATLQEVARYTKAAEQRRLARTAIDRLSNSDDAHGFPNPNSRFGKVDENNSNINGVSEVWRPVRDSNPRYQRERLVS